MADAIEGRVKDATFGCRGRLVTVDELDRRVATVDGVLEYHVVQEAADRWTVTAVCDRRGADARLAGALGDLYGGPVPVTRVEAITAEVSGKHRLARCEGRVAEPLFEGAACAR